MTRDGTVGRFRRNRAKPGVSSGHRSRLNDEDSVRGPYQGQQSTRIDIVHHIYGELVLVLLDEGAVEFKNFFCGGPIRASQEKGEARHQPKEATHNFLLCAACSSKHLTFSCQESQTCTGIAIKQGR